MNSKKATKKKQINYGLMYLSLIPLFGVVFTLLPVGYIDYAGLNDNLIINLYFSAVTVTTLGFGDITPLNEVAALLVGAESVLGVALIGLFLNQVSHKVTEKEKQKDEQGEVTRARLRECDKLLQYVNVLEIIDDVESMKLAVKDFILTIDMHDYRELQDICVNFIADGKLAEFKEKLKSEVTEIRDEYSKLSEKVNGEYWS